MKAWERGQRLERFDSADLDHVLFAKAAKSTFTTVVSPHGISEINHKVGKHLYRGRYLARRTYLGEMGGEVRHSFRRISLLSFQPREADNNREQTRQAPTQSARLITFQSPSRPR